MMLFGRRKSRKERMVAAVRRTLRLRRAFMAAAWVISWFAAIAASSSISAKRAKQT
jgi:hypothetical protein